MLIRTRANLAAGFTLIEVIFSIAFISILATIVYTSFAPLRTSSDLSSTSNQVVATLQLARNRTIASVSDTNYGVHFENNQYVLFSGSTYDSMATDNEVHDLPSGVEIYDISVGGGAEVVFDRITGATSNNGQIGLRLVDDTSELRTISILSSGLVGFAGTTSPTDTRVTDTRHVHFDLGWSIQGATTLTLTFLDPPNPDVIVNVDMIDFFNVGQTEFDWESTIDVGGSPQVLRIHTHALDSSDTELSITRDGRYNDKAVTITIEGQDIASYGADNSVVVGASGGTMTIQ